MRTAGAHCEIDSPLRLHTATEPLDVASGFRPLRDGALPAYRAMLGSDDAAEGPRAFTEKRPPRRTGH